MHVAPLIPEQDVVPLNGHRETIQQALDGTAAISASESKSQVLTFPSAEAETAKAQVEVASGAHLAHPATRCVG